jgi:hypothetical protein
MGHCPFGRTFVSRDSSQITPRSASQGVCVFALEGAVRIGDTVLGRRDSAGFWDLESVDFQVGDDASDVLVR